jgi:hypothetical protein
MGLAGDGLDHGRRLILRQEVARRQQQWSAGAERPDRRWVSTTSSTAEARKALESIG